jgi:hypothetical protein
VLYPEQGLAIDHSVWVMAPHRELSLASPEIQVTQPSDGWIMISSPVYCHAVHFEDHGHEVLSDNWFDLLPGVAMRLQVVQPTQLEEITFTSVTGITF